MNFLFRNRVERDRPFWQRPLILAGLVLGLWAPFKVLWETHIDEEIMEVRYQGLEINRNLRDQLSQNAMIGLLGGFRGVVADLIWLGVTDAWADKDWYRAQKNIELATTLQPRFLPFWENGGWHLAYNASNDARFSAIETDPEERLRQERHWIEQGARLYERGREANPESYRLYKALADVYDQKLQDYPAAAQYYLQASQRPGAPLYLERFPAYMWQKGGMDQEAYEHWKMLWNKYLDQPARPQIAKDKIEESIRELEEKLNVPAEKRIFSNPAPSPTLNP
ncbi:MAG: hypothetical protein AAGK14_10015 [Verrucomicrobiota bacterium]